MWHDVSKWNKLADVVQKNSEIFISTKLRHDDE